MWTDLESVASRPAETELAAMRPRTLADDLREVVAALDRREPRADRPHEADIARESAALRGAALERLATLQESAMLVAPHDGV